MRNNFQQFLFVSCSCIVQRCKLSLSTSQTVSPFICLFFLSPNIIDFPPFFRSLFVRWKALKSYASLAKWDPFIPISSTNGNDRTLHRYTFVRLFCRAFLVIIKVTIIVNCMLYSTDGSTSPTALLTYVPIKIRTIAPNDSYYGDNYYRFVRRQNVLRTSLPDHLRRTSHLN